MKAPEQHVVYGIVDPRSGEIYYVGQTVRPEQRAKVHKGGRTHGKVKVWERELLSQGVTPDFVVLEDHLSIDQIDERERHWIEQGLQNGWPLLNSVVGAPGNGWPLPDEIRQKIADSMRRHWADPDFRAEQTKKIRQAVSRPEVREKLKVAIADREMSQETKEKISQTMTDLWQDPDYREHQQEAVANAARELWQDPDFRKAHAEGMQKPETSAKISEASKRMWQDPEIRAKLTQERRSRTLSEETKAKISQGLRRHWIERRKRKQVAP